ncbi:MAG: DNA polymerase III subunit beta [bacterium]|nr:DNA polymerase III subunit beta [bacterium]
MLISVDKDEFSRILSRVSGAVNYSDNITNHVLITAKQDSDIISIEATDLGKSITKVCPSMIDVEGTVSLPQRQLSSIIKELRDGMITIDSSSGSIALKHGRSTFNITGVHPDNFPYIKSTPANPKCAFTINQAAIKDIFRYTIPSTKDADSSRASFSGIHLDAAGSTLTAVATDGKRLSVIQKQIPITGSAKIVVDTGAAALVKYNCTRPREDASILIDDSSAHIVLEDETHIQASLIVCKYPNYRKIIPKEFGSTLIVRREGLIESTRRIVSIFAGSGSLGSVTMHLNSDKSLLSSINDLGFTSEEYVDSDYDGEKVDIVVNSRYLLEALSSTEAEVVEIKVNDALSPISISPTNEQEGDKRFTIIMPMRP